MNVDDVNILWADSIAGSTRPGHDSMVEYLREWRADNEGDDGRADSLYSILD